MAYQEIFEEKNNPISMISNKATRCPNCTSIIEASTDEAVVEVINSESVDINQMRLHKKGIRNDFEENE